MVDEQVSIVEFPPVSPENLVRLGEDLLRASSIPISFDCQHISAEGRQYLSSISGLISRGKISPMGLAEVVDLAKIFQKAGLLHCIFSRSLMPLVVRLCWARLLVMWMPQF